VVSFCFLVERCCLSLLLPADVFSDVVLIRLLLRRLIVIIEEGYGEEM